MPSITFSRQFSVLLPVLPRLNAVPSIISHPVQLPVLPRLNAMSSIINHPVQLPLFTCNGVEKYGKNNCYLKNTTLFYFPVDDKSLSIKLILSLLKGRKHFQNIDSNKKEQFAHEDTLYKVCISYLLLANEAKRSKNYFLTQISSIFWLKKVLFIMIVI